MSKIEKIFKPAGETWHKDKISPKNGERISPLRGYPAIQVERKCPWRVYISILSGIISTLSAISLWFEGFFYMSGLSAWLLFISSLLSIILGILGYNIIRNNPSIYRGKKFAIAGIILGAGGFLILSLLGFVFILLIRAIFLH